PRAVMDNCHRKSRNADEVLLYVLTVRRTVTASSAHRGTHDERRTHLVGIHAAELGRVVEQLIEAQAQEIAKHDLHDRSEPAEGQPIANTNDACFADGSVDDSIGKLIGESASALEGPPIGCAYALTQYQRAVVFCEPLSQRAIERIELGSCLDLSH